MSVSSSVTTRPTPLVIRAMPAPGPDIGMGASVEHEAQHDTEQEAKQGYRE